MNAAITVERFADMSPRLKARIAGAFNLLAIMMGIFASFVVYGRLSFVAELVAGACNVAVTLLLYGILSPVNRALALLAAFFGLVVSTIGALEWHPQGVDIGLLALALYCLLIGYLIFRSNFLPRILGVLMALAGLAWLTVLSTPLAHYLSPYNLANRRPRASIAHPVAPRDGRKRSTMEGAGQRSCGTAKRLMYGANIEPKEVDDGRL